MRLITEGEGGGGKNVPKIDYVICDRPLTFGFVPVNSLFISRPHQTKFHVRQGNCFIIKLNLALLQNVITFGFVSVNSLFISFTSLCFRDFPSISPGTIRLVRRSLLTYHHYCALTNYIHHIGLEPDVMRANLQFYTSFKSLS